MFEHLHILHVDMDAFFASVEQLDHPEWRGKPVVVGAPPDQRGVVSAASYEARKFGIHSAMPSREAGRRCPQAIFTPVRHERYREVSRKVFEIFERYTPEVEPLSIDEAFLDVSGSMYLFGDAVNIAEHIRAAIQNDLGLTASVGVAPNKFLAKLASDMNKPDGITVTPLEQEAVRCFLAPLPIRRLWGVGPRTAEALTHAGCHSVGDLQHAEPQFLERLLGASLAQHLTRLAFGMDDRSVETSSTEKSISAEHTFDHDTMDEDVLHQTLVLLAEKVGHRLREGQWTPGILQLKIRDTTFKTITRRAPFHLEDSLDTSLIRQATSMFAEHKPDGPIRLLGVGTLHLSAADAAQQLDLFLPPVSPSPIDKAVDELRKKLGSDAIMRGARLPTDRPLS